jgi:hypothetical protein
MRAAMMSHSSRRCYYTTAYGKVKTPLPALRRDGDYGDRAQLCSRLPAFSLYQPPCRVKGFQCLAFALLTLDPPRDPAGQWEIEQASYKFRLIKKGGEEIWEQTYI